jgi:hypothetical protein
MRGDPRREPSKSFFVRLREDVFVFGMCLVFLAFTTWALAISWWLMKDPVLLVLTVASLAPAFYLFYLRERPAPAGRGR